MKAFVCALLVALCAASHSARPLNVDIALFADFKLTYNRVYTPSEEVHRLNCFRQTLDTIDQLNSLEGSAMHGVNQFADLCADEFKMYHNLQHTGNRTYNFAPLFSHAEVKRALAGSVDWRTKGAVTHVKNQGQCGSCWSFSATGNMEGQHFLKGGNKLVALSEEELVQCSKNGNQGCNGGLMDNAFEWVTKNGGIDSESDYPYTSGGGRTGTCDETKLKNVVAKFSSHTDVAHSEDQMATWVGSNGPLSVAVDAAQGWQTYRGGIMKTCRGRQLDHGVLAVGYGEESSTPYWIVKNSWGASWGENGYIRLERGSNQCGINMDPSSSKV